MVCSDLPYYKVYSNKTRNIAVFLPKTGVSIIETVPYSFSKVFQAFQPSSRCNQTSSILWHVRIFDIPKCIPNKTPNTAVFLLKTEISIADTVSYSFSKVFQAFQSGWRCNQTSFIGWPARIFDISKCTVCNKFLVPWTLYTKNTTLYFCNRSNRLIYMYVR